ncbi:MAG: cytidine deaminase [Candidatus Altimarinota bacterium]
MPSKTHTIEYQDLAREELSQPELNDLETATLARLNAHAPYSNFKVGATIRTNDDQVFEGWNVENIVYDGLHAEENALGRIPTISREQGLKSIIVVGGPHQTDSEEIVTPCGACRQKLLEFIRVEDNPSVIMGGIRGRIIKVNLRDLLPFGFSPESIKK